MQMKDNRAIFRPVSRDFNAIEQELAESQIEPIRENQPHFTSVTPQGVRDRNFDESQMEAVHGNNPHFKSLTPNPAADG